jgi:hypothetical protein
MKATGDSPALFAEAMPPRLISIVNPNIMMLMKAIIVVLLFASFIALWRLIGRRPESVIKLFPFFRKRIQGESILHVFSAETLIGKEAEFINERLPQKNAVIKFFRFLLVTLYVIIIVCLIFLKSLKTTEG